MTSIVPCNRVPILTWHRFKELILSFQAETLFCQGGRSGVFWYYWSRETVEYYSKTDIRGEERIMVFREKNASGFSHGEISVLQDRYTIRRHAQIKLGHDRMHKSYVRKAFPKGNTFHEWDIWTKKGLFDVLTSVPSFRWRSEFHRPGYWVGQHSSTYDLSRPGKQIINLLLLSVSGETLDIYIVAWNFDGD